MKHLLVALLALSGTVQALGTPIDSARNELEQNRAEVLLLKKDLSGDALPKVDENLARLADSQKKINEGLQRVDETKKQMGMLRGFAHVLDPMQKRNLGQLSRSYDSTVAKVHTLSAQFARLAGPLKRDLLQTRQDLRSIVERDGLIDHITQAQDTALSRLQGVKSFIFGSSTAPDGDESPAPPASR